MNQGLSGATVPPNGHSASFIFKYFPVKGKKKKMSSTDENGQCNWFGLQALLPNLPLSFRSQMIGRKKSKKHIGNVKKKKKSLAVFLLPNPQKNNSPAFTNEGHLFRLSFLSG